VTTEPISAEVADLLASTAVVCRQWAEQMEGPYRRGDQPLRRELREDRTGVPLRLGLQLADADGAPLADGEIEVWHCDALGRYSGYPPPDDAAPPPTEGTAPRTEYLPDQTFLRGRQPVAGDGVVEFVTIYPGWYPGRTLHIHLMAHTDAGTATTQLYLPEPINERVLAEAPYRERPGRDTTNATDTIFSSGGEPAVLEVRDVGGGGRGYVAAARLHLP
jgi:protocatechuate 3,4-dioxygenase beta subunit